MELNASRREVVMGAAAWGALAAVLGEAPLLAAADAGESEATSEPFAADYVVRLAEELAKSEFAKPKLDPPEPFNALTDVQYRDIRFRHEQAIWRGQRLDFELELLAVGWLFDVPVEIWIVEEGKASRLKADSALFSLGALAGSAAPDAPYGFSGLRIHGPLNRADVYDDFAVFQGASYVKAMGRGGRYGLSARGLAIDTARPGGEEFPLFRAFWIVRPRVGASDIVVHALLDSASTTGAYRFAITPGHETQMDVDAVLFPRRSLTHVGLAPLTSMFLYGSAHHRASGDFRPAVHNSEGLAVLNGMGERLWRPLTNPRMLQTSAFLDKNPKGFGLCQRNRHFASYEDLDARFDRRPTAWVEPKGGWGDGYVELIEIPTDDEIHDNIVAYWKPAAGLEPGKPHRFAYRLSWADDVPVAWAGARVAKTHVAVGRTPEIATFVIDFEGPAVETLGEMPLADLAASAGTVTNLLVQRHPEIQGLRVRFDLETGGTDVIELRLQLKGSDRVISESWLYRWTKP